MTIPARCNKRNCQTRRNLSKRPQLYKYWPTCNMPGCDGKMYVDEYRLRGMEEKIRPTCHEDCYPYPHRVDSPHCRHRIDYQLAAAERRSKHNPNQHHDTPDEAPF